MSNITSLIDSGLDAFTNLYDIEFTFPKAIAAIEPKSDASASERLSVRSQDFMFPTLTIEKYPVAYKAVILQRIKPKIVGERKFTLSFRVDNSWQIYNKLKAWKRIYMNEFSNVDGSAGTDINFLNLTSLSNTDNVYGRVKVKSFKSNTSINSIDDYNEGALFGPVWDFKQVMCKNVVEPTFTRDSAEPIVIQAEFIFGEYTPAGEV